MIFNTKREMSDTELLDAQKEYKIPILEYTLSRKWYVYLVMLFAAWIVSMIFGLFDLFPGYSYLIAFLIIVVASYNYLNSEKYRP